MREILSVIIPVYNSYKHIKRCLDSVLGQTYKDMEIICVNDGSTDASLDILNDYARKDGRIKVIDKIRGGNTSARKAGLAVAEGDYVAFVDSDDWIDEDMYDDLMGVAISNNADVVISQEIREYNGYSVKKKPIVSAGLYFGDELSKLKGKLIRTDCFYGCSISGHLWDKVFKKEAIKGRQEEVPDIITICEDAVVAYSAIWGSNRVFVSDKAYYHYCLRSDSVMGKARKEYENVKLKNESQDAFCFLMNKICVQFRKTISNIDLQTRYLFEYQKMFCDLEGALRWDGETLYPYGKISSKEWIVLYGSGKFGRELKNFFDNKGWFEKIIWVDKNGSNGACDARFINWDVVDKVIVGALLNDIVENIKEELICMGIFEDKILIANPLRDYRL